MCQNVLCPHGHAIPPANTALAGLAGLGGHCSERGTDSDPLRYAQAEAIGPEEDKLCVLTGLWSQGPLLSLSHEGL